jgi:hypothetical protein
MLLAKKKEHNVYLYALIAAILMHLLILIIPLLLSFLKLLFLAIFPNSQLFAADEAVPQPQTEPIVLEFKKPEALPDKFYELYENPNANQQTPEQSNILSNKSSISAAPNPEAPPSPVPKAKFPNAAAEEKSKELPQEVKDLMGSENIYAYNNQRKFSKNLLTGKEQIADDPSEEQQQTTTDVVSEDFDAKLVGDFALSTYEWEWAPYWLDFKKKLYRVWTTPPAYSKLGIIFGYTIIWVNLNRAGEMVDYKVLKHEGHNSLLESSVGAIRSSFPFKPLPANFPDEYLEITFLLRYPNLRELSSQ